MAGGGFRCSKIRKNTSTTAPKPSPRYGVILLFAGIPCVYIAYGCFFIVRSATSGDSAHAAS